MEVKTNAFVGSSLTYWLFLVWLGLVSCGIGEWRRSAQMYETRMKKIRKNEKDKSMEVKRRQL